MKIGDRVWINDPKHPWVDHGATVTSEEETYGLGWKGYRVKVDETCGQECYVRQDQVLIPRVDKMVITYRRRCNSR